jgi:hypothetical protein
MQVGRQNRLIQVVSKPQPTPSVGDARLRIFAADALQKSLNGRLTAIARGQFCWHTTRPRTGWNYDNTWHCERQSIWVRRSGVSEIDV